MLTKTKQKRGDFVINYKLKSIRVREGKTQADVAKILNISKASYLKKENGLREFSLKEVIILKNYFNLSLHEVWDVFFNQKVNINETKRGG